MEHFSQWIQLALTIITLVFAIGVWKGTRDTSNSDIVERIAEFKTEFEKYRDRHHKAIEGVQSRLGNLLSVKEMERYEKLHDEEHRRIWNELDRLREDIYGGNKKS